jgi:hypothetical protein
VRSVDINSDLPDNGVSSSNSSSDAGMNSNLPKSVSSSSGGVSSSSFEEQGERVRVMLPWIHLCGRCLFFAGSQLLLAMEDPAAARAPSVDATAFERMQQVSACPKLLDTILRPAVGCLACTKCMPLQLLDHVVQPNVKFQEA